jgi:hypothetical protein
MSFGELWVLVMGWILRLRPRTKARPARKTIETQLLKKEEEILFLKSEKEHLRKQTLWLMNQNRDLQSKIKSMDKTNKELEVIDHINREHIKTQDSKHKEFRKDIDDSIMTVPIHPHYVYFNF